MWHWLSYVFPSVPHTGCRMKGQEHGWGVVAAVVHSPSCAFVTPLCNRTNLFTESEFSV